MSKPNPGGAEAIAQGCTCPVLDNNNGKGVNGNFWYSSECELHTQELEEAES